MLFAIGITIDIAIGFIFLIFFHAWGGGGQAPKDEKKQKDKANGNVNGNANGKKISTTCTKHYSEKGSVKLKTSKNKKWPTCSPASESVGEN